MASHVKERKLLLDFSSPLLLRFSTKWYLVLVWDYLAMHNVRNKSSIRFFLQRILTDFKKTVVYHCYVLYMPIKNNLAQSPLHIMPKIYCFNHKFLFKRYNSWAATFFVHSYEPPTSQHLKHKVAPAESVWWTHVQCIWVFKKRFDAFVNVSVFVC